MHSAIQRLVSSVLTITLNLDGTLDGFAQISRLSQPEIPSWKRQRKRGVGQGIADIFK